MMGRCSSRRPMLVHHIMFIAMNACFRLNDQTSFETLVLERQEVTGLAALDRANSKFSRGYSVTGVGMGVCARDEFVLPNGVGDLQAGERYSNLDCIFASFMRRLNSRLPKLISYDIVWQNAHQRSLDPVPNPVFSTLHSRFGQAHASVDLALDGINSTTWNWMKTLGPALLLLDMAAEEWAKQEQDIDFRRQLRAQSL
ncbi:CxC2 domain-containing protein [Mycena indigotica]|uniref:CxC2 domain-containing protein n=1 Tax=Mycena indigotica TaxID=2126181 RepID=A0A8H6RX04_9AGAR|nr:CxC2 domain-containing protein [Mycena indigotica]KAF7288448.1 CxC2 domain-containing protein [Mycena indigotica]